MAKNESALDKALIESDENSRIFNPLLNALRENDKKNLFNTNVTTAFIKTGFHQFDYYFGSVINVHDKLGNITGQEPRVGQAAGTFNLIIGNTGSGKTTLAVQIAGNIIRQYPYANVIHYDCENRTDISRCENITKLPASYFDDGEGNSRYTLKSGAGVGLDTIQEMIVKLYVTKVRLKEQLMVKSGFKNEFGKDVMIYQPTVIIIDSLTTVMNDTFNVDNNKEASEAEKMRGNTEGARDAKTLKGFLKDIIPLCKEADIIVYGISHININMSMNAFIPVTKQQNFLKQDESIPGGRMMLYSPYNIIKLTAHPSDDFTEESDGFAGHMVMVEPIKSSSNQSGNNSKGISFELVFAFRDGFDPLRSMIIYGKENGLIEGNKSRMKFRDDPSFTFSFKDIYKEKDEKPIWENIKKYIVPDLNRHLPYMEPAEQKFDERMFDY
jgi:energy-coupling factor transporter ATP-binding protein EcfA2